MKPVAPIRLSDRLIAIVETFLVAPSQSLSQVSAACGIEPSTTTRYLRQLVAHDWLERDEETRAYRLGVRLVAIGQAARATRPLRQRALPYMRELLGRFDETINLAVHQSGEVVVVEALESSRSIRRGASVGDRDDWFVSSLGKAILAHLPEETVRELYTFDRSARHARERNVRFDEVLADLEMVRQRGYAIDDEDAETGLKCIGVAIRDHRGRYSHAISISGPTARMNERLTEIIDTLTATARGLNSTQQEAL